MVIPFWIWGKPKSLFVHLVFDRAVLNIICGTIVYCIHDHSWPPFRNFATLLSYAYFWSFFRGVTSRGAATFMIKIITSMKIKSRLELNVMLKSGCNSVGWIVMTLEESDPTLLPQKRTSWILNHFYLNTRGRHGKGYLQFNQFTVQINL